MGNSTTATGNVAANVRRIRTENSWSLAEVSAALKRIGHPMGLTTLSKLETGDRKISVDDLQALAVVLRVDVQELMTDPAFAPHRDLTAQVETWAEAMDATFEHRCEADDYEQEAHGELAATADAVPGGWDIVHRHLAALGKAGVPWIAEALDKAVEYADNPIEAGYDLRRSTADEVVIDLADVLNASLSDPVFERLEGAERSASNADPKGA